MSNEPAVARQAQNISLGMKVSKRRGARPGPSGETEEAGVNGADTRYRSRRPFEGARLLRGLGHQEIRDLRPLAIVVGDRLDVGRAECYGRSLRLLLFEQGEPLLLSRRSPKPVR